MWNGMLLPTMRKSLTSDDVSFDPDNTDDPESMDPDKVTGTLSIVLSGTEYTWPDITYQEYLDFEAANFSRSWMNENLPIDYVGDWGWPYGRVHNVRAGKSGTFFTI